MDEEEYEIGEEWYRPSRKLQKVDFAILGVNLVGSILGGLTESLQAFGYTLAAHANFNLDQRAFHEEAALEIETLINEEVED